MLSAGSNLQSHPGLLSVAKGLRILGSGKTLTRLIAHYCKVEDHNLLNTSLCRLKTFLHDFLNASELLEKIIVDGPRTYDCMYIFGKKSPERVNKHL